MGKQTTTEYRRTLELMDLNLVLSARLYGLKPNLRLEYIEEILCIAASQSGGLLRALLGNQTFTYPDRTNRSLFHNKNPTSYCTFPQACNRYLITSPRRCYLKDFLKGVPEPCTGEVMASGYIDDGDGHGLGWQPISKAWKDRKGRTRQIGGSRVPDPEGRYIHSWYLDGVGHREGAAKALLLKKRSVTI